MENRNQIRPKDDANRPKSTSSVPTDPDRAPMQGDVNVPSPTTLAEEGVAKPYEGQMREHERHEPSQLSNNAAETPPTRSQNPPARHGFQESPKQSMPPDDYNDPIVPTDRDVELPPPSQPGKAGKYAPKGGSKAVGNQAPDSDARK